MGIFSRFFEKKSESKQMDNSIIANPDIDSPVGYLVNIIIYILLQVKFYSINYCKMH